MSRGNNGLEHNCAVGMMMMPSAGKGSAEESFVIGVAGGTASGKTTVCDLIMQRLHEQCVVILSQDSFYRGLTDQELKNVSGGGSTLG